MLNCFTVEGHVLTAINGKLSTLEGHNTCQLQMVKFLLWKDTFPLQVVKHELWRGSFKQQIVKLPLWRDRFKLQRAKLPLWRDKVLVWRYECGQLVCLEHPLVHVQIVLVPHCL
uniref:Uncharacterized protein n=1 Tax=Cacopsylla melanoneura TaxID=428564 RepID=A0A8D9A191_9HEMI